MPRLAETFPRNTESEANSTAASAMPEPSTLIPSRAAEEPVNRTAAAIEAVARTIAPATGWSSLSNTESDHRTFPAGSSIGRPTGHSPGGT